MAIVHFDFLQRDGSSFLRAYLLRKKINTNNKQTKPQAGLHLVKPLKPLNGYHPLRKLTNIPACKYLHTLLHRNDKISSPEKHFGMCLTHKLQALQLTSVRVFIHSREARATAPCWIETEGAAPHVFLIRSKPKEVLVPHQFPKLCH